MRHFQKVGGVKLMSAAVNAPGGVFEFQKELLNAMTHQEIFVDITHILSSYIPGDSQERLTEATDILNDLGINSARLVDIVLDLENKFKIRIDDSEISSLNTIGDAVNLVAALVPGEMQMLKAGAD